LCLATETEAIEKTKQAEVTSSLSEIENADPHKKIKPRRLKRPSRYLSPSSSAPSSENDDTVIKRTQGVSQLSAQTSPQMSQPNVLPFPQKLRPFTPASFPQSTAAQNSQAAVHHFQVSEHHVLSPTLTSQHPSLSRSPWHSGRESQRMSVNNHHNTG
jgi:hypothetical protein